ncbi:glycosyltransferase family 4 protein [Anoxybacillus sp. LAT_38]|uniref:glycosyltransferase family 4 protein n=1 Tax=Anoxybacillus sp. LAT_26 TaxID=2862719 RepID=UPI001EEA4C19|nr:glycosyltransferase family 4 protein [Anoxybacillus sp. LAT_26]MCG6182589.1 glycosyltransferase family 4 protein [Anoxybacillus sp. LAT_26]MCG6197161.1 glycosyltransferase family 4 protein [Anoxybacillus sp. LAT_38]
MRIAFICTEKLPSPAVKGGAIQLMIDGIAPMFAAKHTLTIFSITDPSLPMYEIRDGIEYVRVPKEQYEQHIVNELKKRTFDVIHVFNRPANVLFYKQAAPNSRFVTSLHNDMFSPMKMKRDVAERVIAEVDAITTVSEYMKRTVTKRYDVRDDLIHVVYSGVDATRYTPPWTEEGKQMRTTMRQRFGTEDDDVILFIGRLSKTKGVHVLIESMNHVLAERPKAKLVIVGGKWFSDNRPNEYVRFLHQLAKPYNDRIQFTNYIPSEHIPHIFTIGDVFVCSSQWHEPLARVHYEAMAAGVPIVTTNRGGNSEVIEHNVNGLVVDDYASPKAFARAISELLHDKEKALALAHEGRKRAETTFSFANTAEQLERVYITICQ